MDEKRRAEDARVHEPVALFARVFSISCVEINTNLRNDREDREGKGRTMSTGSSRSWVFGSDLEHDAECECGFHASYNREI